MSRFRSLPKLALACCVPAVLAAAPLAAGPLPGVSLSFMQVDSAGFPAQPTTLRSRVQGASVGLEVLARETWALHAGLAYAYTRHEYVAVSSRNRDLHRVAMPLTVHAASPTGGRHEFTLAPVVATSSNVFKDLLQQGRSEDWQWHGAWRWQAPNETGWRWQFGLARNDALGRLAWLPEAGASLRTGDWHMSLVLPHPRLRYQPRPELAFEVSAQPAGGQWQVRSDEQAGRRFEYRVREWETGVAVHWQPSGSLAISAEIGALLHRRHRFIDDAGVVQRRDAGNAGFVRLTLTRPF